MSYKVESIGLGIGLDFWRFDFGGIGRCQVSAVQTRKTPRAFRLTGSGEGDQETSAGFATGWY